MAKRQIIEGPDIPEHNQPFPTAVRVGNMVFSSAIGGDDPETHEMPEDMETQVANCFQTIRNIMTRAGGSVDDIAKMSVLLTDRDNRKFVNPEWVKMFPDEKDRPTRHVSIHDLAPGRLIQIEFFAVI